MKIFRQHPVTCATLFQQTRVKSIPGTSQVLGTEAGVTLGGVTVVAKVVAGAVDADKVDRTAARRNCLPRFIQQKNWDSSCMSRKNL